MSSRVSGNLYGEQGEKSRIANFELRIENLYNQTTKERQHGNTLNFEP
jgi:hypothetical protein